MEISYIVLGLILLFVLAYVEFGNRKVESYSSVNNTKRKYHKYTPDDVELLNSDKTDKELAELLNVSIHSIRSKRKRINK